ncbi:hypothetical protein HPT29_018010 [Microvirga terrae]|uniref:Uncharacterized protein n=1 Tax=Microvirga terrae TaxID=2740529 RepID=A0ABY5RMD6_9HYPH|nr:hypothetical protein [Microvirga terrae]UVF18391.1 hypothetical protein HPT29_018010 [Microvirga terrae]
MQAFDKPKSHAKNDIYYLPVLLSLAAAVLAILHIFFQRKLEGAADNELVAELARLFNLDREATIPTWFSALLWQLAALFALDSAKLVKRHPGLEPWRWYMLAALCLFLSLDEAASFHETIGALIGDAVLNKVGLNATFYYPWVVFGLLFSAIVGLIFVPFLKALPRSVLIFFVAGAIVFMSGAVGCELIASAVESGAIEFPFGLSWRRLVALEEFLEMLGINLLIHGLLRFRAQGCG